MSPDIGGVKRARAFADTLGAVLERVPDMAFVEKYRSAGVVSGEAVVGNVADRVVVIIDDLISTGGTLARAAAACRSLGARAVYAAATHGVFVGGAAPLADAALAHVFVTDTVPLADEKLSAIRGKISVMATAELFAGAIAAAHSGGSIRGLPGQS